MMKRYGFQAVFAALMIVTAANALDLSWHTFDGGGGTSTGGDFALSGTAGQPDAGVLAGGNFQLIGGFWTGSASAPEGCIGDLDGDGMIGVSDLSILLSNLGLPGGPADGDLDGNGTVGLEDLSLILAIFGTECD